MGAFRSPVVILFDTGFTLPANPVLAPSGTFTPNASGTPILEATLGPGGSWNAIAFQNNEELGAPEQGYTRFALRAAWEGPLETDVLYVSIGTPGDLNQASPFNVGRRTDLASPSLLSGSGVLGGDVIITGLLPPWGQIQFQAVGAAGSPLRVEILYDFLRDAEGSGWSNDIADGWSRFAFA